MSVSQSVTEPLAGVSGFLTRSVLRLTLSGSPRTGLCFGVIAHPHRIRSPLESNALGKQGRKQKAKQSGWELGCKPPRKTNDLLRPPGNRHENVHCMAP